MDISSFFKKFCIVFLLPLLFRCGGDVDTYPSHPSPNISLSDSSYDFGGVVVNNSSDKTLTITNTGNEPLSIGSISGPGAPFTILADTCSNKTLAANRTCSVITRFSPIEDGFFETSVFIPSNDPDGTVTIGLSGDGYGLNVWINKIEADEFCNVTVDVNVTSPIPTVDLPELFVEDFVLRENGDYIEQSRISGLDPFYEPSPVSVVLAIDWSGSVANINQTVQEAARDFIISLDESDEAAACKFGGEIEFEPEAPVFYTGGDLALLETYIMDDTFDGSGGTDLYDAVCQSIDRAAQGGKDKRVVIVFSDGVNVDSGDLNPDATLTEVIDYATTAGIPVFTI